MPVQQTPERALWPAPSVDYTRLVTTAHALRRRPIGDLTVEDMRLLIGQDMGLPHLLPLALEVLRENPMAEGACTKVICCPRFSPGTHRSGPSCPNSAESFA
ncbi:contact-dependent growth inhibition system immunity protein [Streptomyces bauhiniae]|uniref:contact-dependent growth inhibition system immunity protein n=1 Tax=Streptomyces bauhiniae TaxID=2340725 RepID=UPI003685A9E7